MKNTTANTSAIFSIRYLAAGEKRSKWVATDLIRGNPVEILVEFFANKGINVSVTAEADDSTFNISALDEAGNLVGYIDTILFDNKEARCHFFGLETPKEREARLDAEMEAENAAREAEKTKAEESSSLFVEVDEHSFALCGFDSWIFGDINDYKQAIKTALKRNIEDEDFVGVDWDRITCLAFSIVDDYLPEGISLHPLGYLTTVTIYDYKFRTRDEIDTLAKSAIWQAEQLGNLFEVLYFGGIKAGDTK